MTQDQPPDGVTAARPPRVLFVSHASRSGAPLVLLTFLRWLRSQSDIEPTALVWNGELASEFAQSAPTILVDPPDAGRARRVLKRIGASDGAMASLPTELGRAEGAIRSTARRAVLRDLARRVHLESFDLVYLNSITSAAVLPLVPEAIPVITHVHEMGHGLRLVRHRQPAMITDMLARTTRFIAASQATADDLTDELGVGPSRIDVCHEFISIEDPPPDPGHRGQLREQLGVDEDTRIVGAVGRIEWRKGADLFVQVAKRTLELSPRDTKLLFVWVGPASEYRWREYIEHDIRALGLGDRVRLLDAVIDARTVMGSFDVFLLTSRSDPYPLVCLEAAAMAKPIVCFDAGGMREFLKASDDLLVPYLDTDGMARRVISLIESPAEAHAVGQRLARRVRERHHVDSAAPILLRQIRHTMDERRRSLRD